MRYAVLSDIHANWEALKATLDYLQSEKIDETWVLGDVVGYGANPEECLAWAFEKADVFVAGNHEKAVVNPEILEWFSGDARQAIEWTTVILTAAARKKLEELAYQHLTGSATLVHGSPDQPEEFRYLFSFEDARPSFRALQTPLGFIGHTHLPSLFKESTGLAAYLRAGLYGLNREERYLLNPGSVGQPRDRDPRLSFGIFDDTLWTFQIVRLKYDNETAANKIRQAGLPTNLAERLL